MIIVLFGPPGCGKKTQATRIQDAYRVRGFDMPIIETGEKLRDLKKGIGREELRSHIGDEIIERNVQRMLSGRYAEDGFITDLVVCDLKRGETRPGFILDGFPRTAVQARSLGVMASAFRRRIVTVEFLFDVAECDARLALRREIDAAGGNEPREDDSDEKVIATRKREVEGHAAAALEALKKESERLITVDARSPKTKEDVFESIMMQLSACERRCLMTA